MELRIRMHTIQLHSITVDATSTPVHSATHVGSLSRSLWPQSLYCTAVTFRRRIRIVLYYGVSCCNTPTQGY